MAATNYRTNPCGQFNQYKDVPSRRLHIWYSAPSSYRRITSPAIAAEWPSFSASDLAAAERVRPQAVAPTLAVLAERGLIERRPDPDDGRRQVVSLSLAGRAMFEDARRAGDEWLTRAMQEHYTKTERHTLLRAIALLDRLTQP